MPPRKRSLVKRSKSGKLNLKKNQEVSTDQAHSQETEEQETGGSKEFQNVLKQKERFEREISELQSLFHAYDCQFWTKRSEMWEMECWNRYIHRSRDLNPLSLPDVNAYLSQWDEDELYTFDHVFKQCQKSQRICEEIKNAIVRCPVVDLKLLKSWMESIVHLHFMMRKKIEIATFLFLRCANENINDESFNMEYFTKNKDETENTPETITLCLWGNLSKNIRHRGLNLPELGFSFELPPDLLKISCAVRILHSSFDNITHLIEETFVPLHWKLGYEPVQACHSQLDLDNLFEEMDAVLSQEKITQFRKTSNLISSDTISAVAKQLQSAENDGKFIVDKNPNAMQFTPPEEPEVTVVEKDEFFVVGGIYHFNLFQLPSPTVKTGNWIFTRCEERILTHLPYQTSIIPIRHPKPDMSPALAAEFADSEIKRFDREMCNALTISLRLPKNVVFLEQPIPAFWLEDKKGFTKAGFFETKLEEDTQSIFFKTNGFGIIGLLQRKYNNLPYQSWELSPEEEDAVLLSIFGMHITVKLKIKGGDCCIHLIEQDGKPLFSECYNDWMAPEYIVKKLLTMGINIVVKMDMSKYTDMLPKDEKLENWIYSCMSLLCHEFVFSWSKWNTPLPANQIVMRYNAKGNPQMLYRHVLITEDRSMDVKASEAHSKFCEEPLEEDMFFSNFYHLLKCQAEKPVEPPDCEFVNTVFFLLSSCKLFSCS